MYRRYKRLVIRYAEHMSYIRFRNIAAVVQVEQVSAVGDMECVARFFRVELEYTLVFVKYDRHSFFRPFNFSGIRPVPIYN